MPLKVIRQDHFELLGDGYVLLAAPHATGAEADLHMGQIVEEAALVSRSFALVGKVSRVYVDQGRAEAAQADFRRRLEEIVTEYGVRCIFHIQGKREPGIEIGTVLGKTASESTTELVRARLSKDFEIQVGENPEGLGPRSIMITSRGETSNSAIAVEVFHIRFGEEERLNKREKAVNSIAEIVTLINTRLGHETLPRQEQAAPLEGPPLHPVKDESKVPGTDQ